MKCGAFIDNTLYINGTLVGFNYALNDGKAQYGPADLTGLGLFYAAKYIENSGQFFRGDSNTRVFELYLHVFAKALCRDNYLTSFRGIINSIADKVVENFFDIFRISLNRLEIL